MDTSKEYVKMCRMSEEIQEGYEGNGRIGDFVFNHAGRGNIVIREFTDLNTHQNTWLPRQDQLQEMIKNKFTTLGMIDCFAEWCQEINQGTKINDYIKYFNSMEQLWLAFVMKEKYGKTWNGKDWKINRK